MDISSLITDSIPASILLGVALGLIGLLVTAKICFPSFDSKTSHSLSAIIVGIAVVVFFIGVTVFDDHADATAQKVDTAIQSVYGVDVDDEHANEIAQFLRNDEGEEGGRTFTGVRNGVHNDFLLKVSDGRLLVYHKVDSAYVELLPYKQVGVSSTNGTTWVL